MSLKLNLKIVSESLGVGDNIEDEFTADHIPILAGSYTVYIDGVVTSAYSINITTGVVTFTSPPAVGEILTISYTWNTQFEIYPDSITHKSKAKRKIYPIPDDHPIIVALGEEGPTMTVTGDIGSTQRAKIVLFPAQNTVVVSSSSYDEFAADEEYLLDDKTVDRKGGQVSVWRTSLTLIRKWT